MHLDSQNGNPNTELRHYCWVLWKCPTHFVHIAQVNATEALIPQSQLPGLTAHTDHTCDIAGLICMT